jgi:SOS-response transcriptional repressor LexA
MLTKKQALLLDYIKSHIREHGSSPTYSEMGAALGRCKSNMHRTVSLLVHRGALVRVRGQACALALPPSKQLSPQKALLACQLLVDAYYRGKRRGGGVWWEEVDLAHEAALSALAENKASNLEGKEP